MGLKLDGIATNQQLDSSGEILNVAGHDITDFLEGRGVLNWEHEKGAEDIIGAVIYAKKIMSEKDCENERQKLYWDISGGPYVYIISELYEDEQHPGAVCCSAMVRYYAKRNEKMFIGFSIEGQTLERDGNKLERSVGRRVAFTLRPCNKSALLGVFEDPKLQAQVKKYEEYVPTHREFQIDSPILEDTHDNSPEKALYELRKSITDLNKTLTAGMGNVAPSQLTGGAALVVEDLGLKNRVKAAVRDWNRVRPLKETIKAALPEVSDSYIDHFVNLAEEISLKKGMKPLTRISAFHSPNPQANDDQRRLLEGIYWDQSKAHDPQHNGYSNPVFKLQNDAGENVIVKGPTKARSIFGDTHGAHNATAYYHVANEVFGLGNHVPVTNYFNHPDQGVKLETKPLGRHNPKPDSNAPWQAMKFLDGANTALNGNWEPAANRAQRKDGTMHKLAILDLVTGHGDRHFGNVMVGKDGTIFHIDNDSAFSHDNMSAPAYFMDWEGPQEEWKGIGDDQIHVKAKQWLDQIDPRKLVSVMLKQGMDRPRIENSVRALNKIKALTDQGKNLGFIYNELTKDWD
jgi:hypothetical protein